MAYTYDDFVAAANKAGLMNQFSETDLVTAQKNPEYGLSLLSLKQDELNATTAEQRLLATEAANQLRKSYGTTSALDTQIQNVQDQIGSFGSFQYDNETAYQKALKAVTDPKEFSYDMESDPQYGAMRQSMLRERDRSVADTLARASAASGGVPSSYAVTAAQQAGDYYTGKLGDAGITLYQNALDKYMKERNLDMSRLEALRSDRDDDYQIWLNRLGLLQNQLEQLQGQRADALTDAGNAQNKYQLLLQELDAMKQEEAAKAAAVDGSVSGAMLAAQTALGKQNDYPAGAGAAAGAMASVVGRSTTGAVVNPTDDARGVKIEGKWLSWAELLDGVTKGTIAEVYDPATNKYTYAFTGNNAGNMGENGRSGGGLLKAVIKD